MTRLLLTGGSGFVGEHLQLYLRAPAPETEILAPALDITDQAAVEGRSNDEAGGAAASGRHFRPRQAAHAPARAWAVNVQGTLNLAQAVLAHAPACRFLFISSAEVYGSAFLGAAGHGGYLPTRHALRQHQGRGRGGAGGATGVEMAPPAPGQPYGPGRSRISWCPPLPGRWRV